jgi:hypothetical protein
MTEPAPSGAFDDVAMSRWSVPCAIWGGGPAIIHG